MSVSQLEELPDDPPDGWDQQVSPKLVQVEPVDGGGYATVREVEPITVTRLGGTLPWETESTQLQCGATVTDSNGDRNQRLVMQATITHTQFQTIAEMRQAPQDVRLVSRGYNGPVTFDELKWDRIPDANGAIINDEGENNEPQYEIQLQSKEDEENGTLG